MIGVRIETAMMEAVEAEAEKEERSLAAMARILLREALTARGKNFERKRDPGP